MKSGKLIDVLLPQHTYRYDTRDEHVFASQGHLFEVTTEVAGVGLGGDDKFR